MTVTTNTNKVQALGSGVTKTFPYSFRISSASELVVTSTNTTTGVDTDLVLNTHYTVTGAGSYNGGNVVLSGDAPSATTRITIRRVVPVTQGTDLRNQGAYFAETHEDAFDKLTMIAQQQQEAIDRSLTLSPTSSGVSAVLPNPEANNILAWNAAGTALENHGPVDNSVLADQLAGVEGVGMVGNAVDARLLAAPEGVAMVGNAADVRTLADSSGSSTIGFVQSGAGAVLRTSQDKQREIISVKDYGAAGDGVANDTAAFNNTPAGIVIIPAGTYKLGAFVPKSNTVYVGSNGTVFTLLAGASSIVAFPNGGQNIEFRNIKFVGSATSDSPALSVVDNSGVAFRNNYTVENCVFETFGGMAIAAGGMKGGLIHGCRFAQTGLLNNPSGTISLPSIWISDAWAGAYDQASNVTVSDCSFQDTWWSAIYALGTDLIIAGNRFKNTRESTIFISPAASNVSVTGNTFYQTTMQNISASAVEVGCDNCTVTGNNIAYAGMYGISIQDCLFFNASANNISFCDVGIAVISTSETRPPRYGSAKANKISNSTTYGIQLVRSGAGVEIDDCDLSGNWVTTSGTNNFHCNHASAITSRVSINDNWAESKLPFVTQINVGALGTGSVTLFSVPFRPRSIAATVVQAGQPRYSLGTATLEADGTVKQYSNYVFETSSSISENFIEVTNPGPVTAFNALLNLPVWNIATQKWDVKATIGTNNGAAFWATFTVYP